MFVFERRRQIKRDLAGNVTDKKGIAGIRTTVSSGTTVSNTTATDTAVDDLSNQGNLFRDIDKKPLRDQKFQFVYLLTYVLFSVTHSL